MFSQRDVKQLRRGTKEERERLYMKVQSVYTNKQESEGETRRDEKEHVVKSYDVEKTKANRLPQ